MSRWVKWGLPLLLLFLLMLAGMFYLNHEPAVFDVNENARASLQAEQKMVTGFTTGATMLKVGDILLNKRGGYLSNDKLPPWVFLDNVPNWEFGVLTQMRDMARSMRNDISRSQTQSTEDKDLAVLDAQLHFDHASWALPRTEKEYQKALGGMQRYLQRLSDPQQQNAQFFARADNLRDWLSYVEKRLGSVSQRLSASVGQQRVNTDLSGDPNATQSTTAAQDISVKTSWFEIDDVFYESRGTTWALIHFMKAMEVDFFEVLKKKNAVTSFRQIIRELEATQTPLGSPMVLNGSPFGLFSNHSLVMANYISRANAAIIDLRILLEQG
ncbi:MAG: DUF2333 family protein [Xanthomonadales bacterium]|nr:DUF2333 family protein [Xanthomonadales bacterium]